MKRIFTFKKAAMIGLSLAVAAGSSSAVFAADTGSAVSNEAENAQSGYVSFERQRRESNLFESVQNRHKAPGFKAGHGFGSHAPEFDDDGNLVLPEDFDGELDENGAPVRPEGDVTGAMNGARPELPDFGNDERPDFKAGHGFGSHAPEFDEDGNLVLPEDFDGELDENGAPVRPEGDVTGAMNGARPELPDNAGENDQPGNFVPENTSGDYFGGQQGGSMSAPGGGMGAPGGGMSGPGGMR